MLSCLPTVLSLFALFISSNNAQKFTSWWYHMSNIDAMADWINPCSLKPGIDLQFCNQTLTFRERATNLISLLNTSEMVSISGNYASAIPRLHIPFYNWWRDAAHGLCQGINWGHFPTHSSTEFPQVIGTCSSFNRSLWHSIGDVISTEARAFFNWNSTGLTFWDPNINIFRDPRWGRGQETPGEDPFVNAEYAVHFVRGMQGNDSKYIKVSTTCKHFAAYSLEDSDGYTRHDFNAIVSEYDLNDTYFPPFKYCVAPLDMNGGQSSGVMCSYNAVNGIPSCANSYLQMDKLRDEWKFNGYITSDCGAVSDILHKHHFTDNVSQTCEVVFDSGMDQNCGSFTQAYGMAALETVYGELEISELKRGLIEDMTVLMRLGMFDDQILNPWHMYGPTDVNTVHAQQLSLNAAQQAVILLENVNGTLPLDINNINSIAIIGPNANNSVSIQGNYYGIPPFIITVLQAMQTYTAKHNISLSYTMGCNITGDYTHDFGNAKDMASAADFTILVVGLNEIVEGEGIDRTSILLSGMQNELIGNITSVSNRVILVIVTGGCVDISLFTATNAFLGVISQGYGGMFAGKGIADVIFGSFAVAGLTTQTWYKEPYLKEVLMSDMNMRPNSSTGNPGRGYRYYDGGNVLYPFGYGLSFTQWKCSDFNVSRNMINMMVSNIGGIFDSSGVVLVYWVPENGGMSGKPVRRLIAFERIYMVGVGESVNVEMKMYQEFYWSEEYKNSGNFQLGGICSLL